MQIIITMSVTSILGNRVHQAEEQELSQGNVNKILIKQKGFFKLIDAQEDRII